MDVLVRVVMKHVVVVVFIVVVVVLLFIFVLILVIVIVLRTAFVDSPCTLAACWQ
jgi:hypothetical protein